MSEHSLRGTTKDAKQHQTNAERLAMLKQKALRNFRKSMNEGFLRVCPLCGYEGAFAPAGTPPRLDACCPSCRGRERHRLFKLWVDREARMNRKQRLLHFAPELQLTRLLRRSVGEYVTADLMRPGVNLRLDITAIDQPDASFDAIIAHHILEHVDHHKALAECFRCLKPGGLLVATTPIIEGWAETYENPTITSKRDRFLHFGQDDHIKFFGRDLRAHMVAPGFELEEYVSTEPDVSRYGLLRGETLFILNKPRDRP
jgi:SAM-dependent methyltransferase